MSHSIQIQRSRPFADSCTRALGKLSHAHRAKTAEAIGAAVEVSSGERGSVHIGKSGILRANRPVLAQGGSPFMPEKVERTAYRGFCRDPQWESLASLRDWLPNASEHTVACGLRDALVLRENIRHLDPKITGHDLLARLVSTLEIYACPDLSNHALLEAMAGASAHLRCDLGHICGLPEAEIDIRIIS